MRNLMVVMLILVNALSFAAGRGEEAPEAHPRAGETNRFGWTIPEERIVIEFYHGQDNPDTDRRFSNLRDYIIENFNVQLDRIVYDTDQTERLNLMLASNLYPGVVSHLDDAQYATFVHQGRAQDVTDIIAEHGPNIREEVGEIWPRYLDENGRIHGVPNNFGLLPNPGYSAHIRWDTYQERGAPELVTLDDYYAYLKELVAERPTDEAGDRVYALSLNDQVTPEVLAGFWGLRRGWKVDETTDTASYWINTTEGLDMALWFNRIQREGLLDPNAFINRYEDWKALFSAERVVGHLGSWWHSWNAGHEVWNTLWPDWEPNQRHVQISLRASSVDQARLGPKNVMGDMTVITDKRDDPESVIKWLNFEVTPLGTRLMGFGVPNAVEEPVDVDWIAIDSFTSLWHIDEDGNTRLDDGQVEAYVAGTFDFRHLDYSGGSLGMLCTPLRFTREEEPIDQWFGYACLPYTKWDKLTWDNMAESVFDNTALEEIPYPPDRNEIVIKQSVTDIGKTGFAEAVMAPTAVDCERIFMEMRDRANQAGLRDLETYVTTEYRKNVEAWGL